MLIKTETFESGVKWFNYVTPAGNEVNSINEMTEQELIEWDRFMALSEEYYTEDEDAEPYYTLGGAPVSGQIWTRG